MFSSLLIAVTALASTTNSFTIQNIIESRVEPVKAELSQEQLVSNKIKEVFGKDAPTMIKIAECESGLRQVGDDGKTLVSPTKDSGVFQLNDFAHRDKLKEMKLDPNKLEDNIQYAKHLFDRNGLRDWYMSKHCWSK